MTTRFLRSKAHRYEKYQGGNITLSSTTWATLPGVSDKVLKAAVGDVVVVEFSAIADIGGSSNHVDLDAVSVGGSAPCYWSSDGTTRSAQGVQAWYLPGNGVTGYTPQARGAVRHTIVAGDIVSGQVTIRMQYRLEAAGSGNRTLYAAASQANFVVEFSAWNLGPVAV